MDTSTCLFVGILLGLVWFTFYAEWGIGGILYRPDATGKIVFSLRSLGKLMCEPLHKCELWAPNNWDLNVFITLAIICGITYCINFILTY
jgi:hypothetical protein